MRQSRAPRVLRGVFTATGATFTALLSHLAGGAAMPGLLGIVLPWVLSLMLCTVLARRALSLLRLSVGVALSQVLFHTLFVLGTVSSTVVTYSAGHHASAAVVSATAAPTAQHTLAMVHADPVMWMWHSAAGVLTIFGYYRGERAVLRLRQLAVEVRGWVQSRFRAPLTVPLLPAAIRTRVRDAAGHPVSSVPQRSALQYRGPPPALAL